MYGGDFFSLYYYVILGAIGYALTMLLLNWYRQGWAQVKQALPRYLLALPVSLVVSTMLFVAERRDRRDGAWHEALGRGQQDAWLHPSPSLFAAAGSVSMCPSKLRSSVRMGSS